MRKMTSYRGIGGNFGACFLYYLSLLLLGRMYPERFLPLLAGALLCWAFLPYAELFLHRMTRPIRRALPAQPGSAAHRLCAGQDEIPLG